MDMECTFGVLTSSKCYLRKSIGSISLIDLELEREKCLCADQD